MIDINIGDWRFILDTHHTITSGASGRHPAGRPAGPRFHRPPAPLIRLLQYPAPAARLDSETSAPGGLLEHRFRGIGTLACRTSARCNRLGELRQHRLEGHHNTRTSRRWLASRGSPTVGADLTGVLRGEQVDLQRRPGKPRPIQRGQCKLGSANLGSANLNSNVGFGNVATRTSAKAQVSATLTSDRNTVRANGGCQLNIGISNTGGYSIGVSST